MSLTDIEFVSPENVEIKSEETKNDVDSNGPEFALDPTTGQNNSKCGEIFTSNNLDFLLICAYCGGNYSSFSDFGEHLRCKHQKCEDPVQDDELKSETDSPKAEIVDESSGVNGENDDDDDGEQDDNDDDDYVEKPEKRPKPQFVCKTCNKHYRYKLSFERHRCPFADNKRKEVSQNDSPGTRSRPTSQRNEDKMNASVEDDPISYDSSNNQENSDDDHQMERVQPKANEDGGDQEANNPDLFCEICYRQFKYKNVFRKHGMQHEVAPAALQKDPTYRKCIYCGITFTNNAEWFRHENEHPKTGPLRCSQCSKKFKTEIELEVHAKSHADQGPVKCDQCGMTFSQAKNLSSHINRVHLQLKPFSCELCDRKFVRKVELRVHMRRHTGERPYQCEECGRSFMISTLLNEHLKRHSNVRDVQCPVCPMAFFTKKMLRKHMVKHSTERPYVCPTCGNNFSRKKALLAHKKIHMDVKQYVCNLCGKAFAQHAGLYMHKKTHMNAVDS